MNRKVMESNPSEVVEFFSCPNPSILTMALGFTQPVADMNAVGLSRHKAWPTLKADRLPFISQLPRQYGILNILHPYRLPQPVTGIALQSYEMLHHTYICKILAT
jgi:hypothetical protein